MERLGPSVCDPQSVRESTPRFVQMPGSYVLQEKVLSKVLFDKQSMHDVSMPHFLQRDSWIWPWRDFQWAEVAKAMES